MLFGMLFSAPIGLVICDGAEQVAILVSTVFTGLAVTRWVRQYLAGKRIQGEQEAEPLE